MKGNAYKKFAECGWVDTNETTRAQMNEYAEGIALEKPSNGKKKAKPHKKKKCDHKHEWKQVLLETSYKDPLTGKAKRTLHLGKKCSICDKIQETQWFITVHENGIIRQLTAEEIIEKYSDLEIIDYLG